ncbi:LPS export ABC transporter permease LptG [Nitrosomonas sp. Nm34]|uniref:LPS export ABC transporter permease LptG n=1 Tax=Nitrosomonas sp. Nm34 TaxID=1881055 RepID=UPI0008EA4A63|nr:LPS export ABC transporter permease LptG [Nitrosomonas sp. Nm34]SFI51229.1 lipopolysaccharide export system permease protein [Nitrosomonas sp. Nm34]
MKTASRYIAKQIVMAMALATLVLLPLFSFFDLLEQLDDVGKGTYQTRDAFLYVAMLMPRRFIQIAPFIALLGTVGALGKLAINLELVALRVAGLSPARLSIVPVGIGMAFILIIAVMEQFIAPQLQQSAVALRATAMDKTAELGKGLGIWTRNEHNILRIGEILPGNIAIDIEIMHFNEQNLLATHTHAKFADNLNNELWRLNNVTVRTFTEKNIALTTASTVEWQSFLKAEDISTLTKPPESLSPVELIRHTEFLQETGQKADAYLMAIWRKIGNALMIIAMILLGIPFIFGSVREGLGGKLTLATVIGVGVYLLDQIIANAGLLLQLNLVLTSILPSLILITLIILWLRRIY